MDESIANGILSLLLVGTDKSDCAKYCTPSKETKPGNLNFCQSLFYHATRNNCEDIVKLLKDHGTQPRIRSTAMVAGIPIVSLGLEDGSETRGLLMMDEETAKEVVSFLRDGSVHRDKCTRFCKSASTDQFAICEWLMISAVTHNCADTVKLLINHGVNVNFKHYGVRSEMLHTFKTPLYLAAQYNRVEVAKLLLNSGADPNLDIRPGMNSLCISAFKGYTELFKLLLDYGANTHLARVLGFGVQRGSDEFIKFMLDQEIMKNADKTNALFFAAWRSKKELIELFLNAGTDIINAYSEYSSDGPALHAAFESGTRETVKLLISRGADIRLANRRNQTSLYYAVTRLDNDDYFAKFLLDRGFDINQADNLGKTAIFHAMGGYSNISLSENIIKLLLRRGADINIENKWISEGTVLTDIRFHQASNKEKLYRRKILVMHIAQMRANNLFVSEKNLQAISSDVQLKEFLLKCEKEIECMKGETIEESMCTFFDVLQASSDEELMGLARNRNITEALETQDFRTKFPIYGQDIVRQVDAGKARNNLFSEFNALFSLLSTNKEGQLPKLPLSCLCQIFKYLSDDDANNVSSIFA